MNFWHSKMILTFGANAKQLLVYLLKLVSFTWINNFSINLKKIKFHSSGMEGCESNHNFFLFAYRRNKCVDLGAIWRVNHYRSLNLLMHFTNFFKLLIWFIKVVETQPSF